MASDVRLIISGTNYYFAYGKAAAWTGSGTPWTSQSTTPYELADNAVTGEAWTPTADAPTRAYAPALNGGGALAVSDVSYDVVTEQIPIQIRGSTPANRALAYRALKRALDTGLNRRAVVLAVEPNDPASTLSPVYYEVLAGDVQPLGRSMFGAEQQRATTDGRQLLRATLTLVRRPLGGCLQGTDSPETAVNSVTLTNTITSNFTALTCTRGDLINAGQPMNVTITPISSATISRLYLATIVAGEGDSTGFGSTALSGSYTSMGIATFSGTNLATLLTQYPVTPRLFVRLSSIGATTTIKINLALAGGSTYHTIDFSDTSFASTATGRLIDCGDIPIPITPGIGITGNPDLRVDVQGAGSGNATVGFVEVLFYYDFCVIGGVDATSSIAFGLAEFPANDGRVMLPFEQAQAYTTTGGTQVRTPLTIQGTPPRCRNGGYLWMYATTEDQWAGVQNTAHTYTVVANQAPLYAGGLRAD